MAVTGHGGSSVGCAWRDADGAGLRGEAATRSWGRRSTLHGAVRDPWRGAGPGSSRAREVRLAGRDAGRGRLDPGVRHGEGPGRPAGSPGGRPRCGRSREPEDGARIAIIRVVRGVTRPGELEAYLDDARAGVLGDRSTGGGPLALYLAIDPPDRFLTLSLWGSWSHVEAATGADHEHVERTRHEERLVTWSAEHYEVVPGLAMVRGEG